MRETLPMVAACLLALLGFALLALNQERHFLGVCPHILPAPRSSRMQRALGFLAIVSGLPLSIAAQGASFGSLLWAMLLIAAAMAVAFTLTWWPHWLRPVAAAVRAFLVALPSNSRGKHVSNPANYLP